MEKYVCVVCGWVYDEAVEGVKFEDQPADYVCPICGVGDLPKGYLEST
ncbi:rubredoxin [Veillonella sp.]|nr:rubredoxin [Veillonella sp.]MDU4115525.1 rubredoxin [Veillonella sp.]